MQRFVNSKKKKNFLIVESNKKKRYFDKQKNILIVESRTGLNGLIQRQRVEK